VAHAHIKRVADEFYRLRAKLSKGEGTETMDTEQMIQQCGDKEIIALKAEALRKRDPSLTPEQAFAKIYTAPENLHLRLAERSKNGFIRYTDDPAAPAAMEDPIAKQADALDELDKRAEEYRSANPSLSPEQCFAKIYCLFFGSKPSSSDEKRL
jgi:hypothetical protein